MDAARYGQGLGESLAANFAQMPQQRAQLAMQLGQMQAQQQQAMQQQMLRQQQMKAEQDYRNQSLGIQREQLGYEQQKGALALERLQKQLEAEQARARILEAKANRELISNKETGMPLGIIDYSQGNPVWKAIEGLQGAGGTTIPAGFGAVQRPATVGQEMKNVVDLAKLYGAAQGMTNNVDRGFTPALSNLFYGAVSPRQQMMSQQPSLGMTNRPAGTNTMSVDGFNISW